MAAGMGGLLGWPDKITNTDALLIYVAAIEGIIHA
jgi:hypothetical protein